MQHKKRFESYFYSTIGVAAMALSVVAINVIIRPVSKRLDLTADKSYTMSDGTKRILHSLDTPVQIRFYFSQKDPATPVDLKTYAAQVEDMLNEYRLIANGNVEIKKLDPVPDTEAEDSANLDGIEGQMIQALGGDPIYFGLAVSCLDERVAIPFLDPRRERLLEYDLTRAIAQVSRPRKPVIGVMSGLPVFGGFNPAMMRMGGGGRTEPWLFVNELRADFDVREVPLTSEKIDDDIQVLMVIYPKEISEAAEFALDQFVLRGGKLIAFLDPLSAMDSRSDPSNPMQAAASGGASLEHLLREWGLTFDLNKVVTDKEYFTELGGDGGRSQVNPSFLQIPSAAMNSNDVATSQIERLFLPFSGAFDGTPAEGLSETVLIRSSPNSDLIEKMLAQFGGGQDFKPTGKQYALAVRLTGKFKTAFPTGKPGAKEEKKEEAKDDAAKKDETKPAESKSPEDSLKVSKEDNVVVLLGDADMLHEQFYARVQNVFGQRIMVPFSQNLTLVQNFVEQLGGDKDLIGIRSRSVTPRPFEVMRKLQVAAEDRFAAKIEGLEKKRSELRQKDQELRRGKEGEEVILSDEARKEREELKRLRAEVDETLRQERRNLGKDIDSLQTRLKWINILLTPTIVAVLGITLAIVKRRKTGAR